MKLRRCAHLMIEPRETAEFDLENLAVVISNDGTVVTAYRAKRPLKHWRGEW